jgi:hypothetical protein
MTKMTKNARATMARFGLVALAALTLTACGGLGTFGPYRGPNSLIASPIDRGIVDRGVLRDGEAAIVYDPDGCQGWLIDDGIEGYSGRRFDPVSGLPICNNAYPPGTVLGNYQTDGRSNRSDWVKGTIGNNGGY